jgi:hypothetical protein
MKPRRGRERAPALARHAGSPSRPRTDSAGTDTASIHIRSARDTDQSWTIGDRQRQAEWWMNAVWGRETGFAAFAVGENGLFRGSTYQFTRFSAIYEPWPGDVAGYAEHLVDISNEADVFAAPLLRRQQSRKQGTGIAGHYAWVDFDAPAEGSAQQVEHLLLGTSSFAVDSGQHQHLYVEVQDALRVSELEILNHRLALTLGGDAKWSETTILRPPGSYNHKGRARGAASLPVRLLPP